MGQSEQPAAPATRYRKLAEELREMAAKATSPGTQNELLTLAAQYEKLADDAGRMERWR